jgi:hypothetical protein
MPAKVQLVTAAVAPIAFPGLDAATSAMDGRVGGISPQTNKQWSLPSLVMGNAKHYLNQTSQAFGLGKPFKLFVGTQHNIGDPTVGKTYNIATFGDDPNAGWAIPVTLTSVVAVVHDRVMGAIAGARVKLAGFTWIGGRRKK